MLYAQVSPEAEIGLQQEVQAATDAKWYRRLKVIQLSARRQSVRTIATVFDLCPATVREYITRDNTDGLAGLQREASPGAPTKMPLTTSAWEALLHQRPSQFDRLQTGARNWTQALMVPYLHVYHQLPVPQAAGSICLKQHRLAWNRGKLNVTSPDPLDTVTRDRIATRKKKPARERSPVMLSPMPT